MSLDQAYHSYLLELRLAFSVGSRITKCVLVNFPSLLFPAERFSFSDEAIALIEKITKMTVTEKDAIKDALWVSIKHIIVIIPQLRGWPLVGKREKSLGSS